MRKFYKVFIALLLIIVQIVSLRGGIVAYARDLTSTYNFITDVKLTDRDGKPFGDNIPKDSDLRLTYTYDIPNSGDVKKDDTFTLRIPEQIKIEAGGDFDLRDQSSNLIGRGTLDTNGNITITFTDYAETHSNVQGSFWFELGFDKDKIGDDDPAVIKFEVGGTTDPVEISVDFDQPAPLPVSIAKSGSYKKETNEITWILTVNPENVTVKGAQVVDKISDGLEFVPGSVTINGKDASTGDYTYNSGELIYNFPDIINNTQTVTFKTTVKDSQFTAAAENTVIIEKNKATLNHDGTFTVSNEPEVGVPVDFISKTGNYNTESKQIDWAITVNQNGVNIDNAVVTDTLPDGLTLDGGSVKIDDESSSNFTYSYPDITFNLGEISEKHTIGFSTDVEDEAFLSNTQRSYTNKAKLVGDGVPGSATDSKGVEVPTSIVKKEGISYNASTGEIRWKVTVNKNKVSIENPVITDLINIGQEYVEGSATIDNGADSSGFAYTKALEGDIEKTGTLIYTFGKTISDTYTIEFRTKVTDPAVFAGNSQKTYKNTASITGDNIEDSSFEGSQNVNSEVIKKTGTGYDYKTREISWKVVVNKNAMLLSHAVFTDDIPKGMEYVKDSAAIDNGADADAFSYSPADAEDPDKTGVLKYTFPDTIDKTYIITFKTKITDLSIFNTNGDKEIKNNASLTHDLVKGGVVSTGSQKVNNTVISKEGSYTSGKRYIDWTVNINSNGIPLTDAAVTDQLQEGLALDTASVKLYHQSIDKDGNMVAGEEIELTGENVQYDLDSRLFTFKLPSPVSGGYKLTFRTNVMDKSKSPFTNEAKFNGTGSLQKGTSQPMAVNWSGSGSTGSGEVGSITVYKVDAENNIKKLEGAEFELIDKYGNVVQKGTTGKDGSVLFGTLRFDVPYTVKETVAPTGYSISKKDYTFTISGADVVKDISYEYEDARIYGSIRFSKTGTNSSPLAGAEFTLYDGDGNSVATTVSAQDGEVLFKHVPYGDYTIRETNPPEGYLPTDAMLTASVRKDGEIVTASPASISNEIIKGNIKITKIDESGEKPLEGAAFTLYSTGDAEFSIPIAKAVTGEDGIALFSDIPYGKYVIRETAAPAGYLLSDKTLTAYVNENGKTFDLGTFADRLIPPYMKIHGNIEILKTNTNGEPLKNARFGLYNEKGNLIAEAVSDGSGTARFTDIAYGHYTIAELEAPYMYVKSDKVIKADIVSDGVVLKYTLVNNMDDKYLPKDDTNVDTTPETPPTVSVNTQSEAAPKTGDSIPIMLWLFAESSLSICAVVLLGKKKNR